MLVVVKKHLIDFRVEENIPCKLICAFGSRYHFSVPSKETASYVLPMQFSHKFCVICAGSTWNLSALTSGGNHGKS
jgi:hypothetical protein